MSDLKAINWDGDLTSLTDDDLDRRLNAVSRYIAAGVALRGRDMTVAEGAERAAPVDLWHQAHSEVVRRIERNHSMNDEPARRPATPDEFEAHFGSLPTGPA